MKFHGTVEGLKVVDGVKTEYLISRRFMLQENQSTFGAYMSLVACKLNMMEPFGDEMAALLVEAECRVRNAAQAEKLLEAVIF